MSTTDPYVELARKTISVFINTGKKISPPSPLPEGMGDRAGVFVSLHLRGRLRGCIGTFAPTTESIASEIIEMAISASTADPRFPPLTRNELDDLDISVDVLGKSEEIDSTSNLNPKVYGVIVKQGIRRGLLLPDIEGVDTVEDQIRIAKMKAGIYDDNINLERFRVTRHTDDTGATK